MTGSECNSWSIMEYNLWVICTFKVQISEIQIGGIAQFFLDMPVPQFPSHVLAGYAVQILRCKRIRRVNKLENITKYKVCTRLFAIISKPSLVKKQICFVTHMVV